MKTLNLIFFLTVFFANGQKTIINGILKNAPLGFLEVSVMDANSTKIDTIFLTTTGEWQYELKIKENKHLLFFTGTDAFHLVVKPKSKLSVQADNSLFDESLFIIGDDSKENMLLNRFYLIQEEATSCLSKSIYNADSLSVITEFKDYLKRMTLYSSQLSEAYSFLKLGLPTTDELEHLNSIFLEDYRSNYTNNQIVRSCLGQTFPDLKMIDRNGESVSIKSFMGRVTVIDLWTDWCSVCIGNFPELKNLENEFKGQVNFISLGIDLSFNKEKWLKSERMYDFANSFFLLNEENEAVKLLGVNNLPRYLILDKDLKIIQPIAPSPDSKLLEVYLKQLL